MFTLNGKYTNAVVYTDICEQQAISQDILDFLKIEVVEQFDTIHNYIESTDDCIK